MNIDIKLGDCISLMKDMPKDSIDLILSDLPYGTTRNKWDTIIPMNDMWEEFWRIAKPNTPVVLTSAQPFTTKLISSQMNHFKYELIWSKNKATGFLNAKKQPLRSHENILIFYKKPPVYNPQKTTGHKPSNQATRRNNSDNYGKAGEALYAGGNTSRYPTSVIDIPVINNDDSDKFHPTQKPVALFEWLINTYSNPNDIVLDCCFGSGTAAIACHNTGRNFVGMENDEKYFNLAKERIKYHQNNNEIIDFSKGA